jgi:hypothetical protein
MGEVAISNQSNAACGRVPVFELMSRGTQPDTIDRFLFIRDIKLRLEASNEPCGDFRGTK